MKLTCLPSTDVALTLTLYHLPSDLTAQIWVAPTLPSSESLHVTWSIGGASACSVSLVLMVLARLVLLTSSLAVAPGDHECGDRERNSTGEVPGGHRDGPFIGV